MRSRPITNVLRNFTRRITKTVIGSDETRNGGINVGDKNCWHESCWVEG
jgi:hypothetical protein